MGYGTAAGLAADLLVYLQPEIPGSNENKNAMASFFWSLQDTGIAVITWDSRNCISGDKRL
jgi:hypothetical protein